MASSLEYWKQREKEAKAQAIKDAGEYNARLQEIYKYTAANIERTVNDWYARYAKKNNITMAEARARVSKLDMERYERLAARYVKDRDFSAQANEEMEIYNLTMRINRLELLRAQINLELMAGYDDIEKEMERDLIETAMKEDRRLAGILGDSVIGNERYAKELVNASFRNATFSERLWGNNMPALRTHLEAELRNGLIQGIHPRELARRFRQHYGGSAKDTERLMVTEMRRLQTSVQKESFERNGFREYTFITTGDERVCEDCDALNGQHFKVSEMQPGENAPPMHPSCRCSTAAWMDGDKYKRWIDALASGEDVRWDEFEADDYTDFMSKQLQRDEKVDIVKEKEEPTITGYKSNLSEKLTECKTVEEVSKITQEYFQNKENCKIRDVDFTGCDLHVAMELGICLDNLDSRFSSTAVSVRTVHMAKGTNGKCTPTKVSALKYLLTGDIKDLESEIVLNTLYLSSKQTIRTDFMNKNRSVDSLYAYAAWVDEDKASISALVHEYGHSILPGKINEQLIKNGKSNSTYMTAQRQYRLYIKELNTLRHKIMTMRDSLEGQPDGVQKGYDAAKDVQEQYELTIISTYSKKSVGDFIAEAFCDAECSSNPRKASKGIYDLLVKECSKRGD